MAKNRAKRVLQYARSELDTLRRLNAVVLAAGRGRRLGRLGKLPKAMLRIRGTSIISRQLRALRSAGIRDTDVVVVGGHCFDQLRRTLPGSVRAVYNPFYDSANNIVSLWLALQHVSGPLLLINSDVVFDDEAIERLASTRARNALAVRRHGPLGTEEMKIATDSSGKITAISKTLSIQRAGGEYMGLAKFSESAIATLESEVAKLLRSSGQGLWYESAISRLLRATPIAPLWLDGIRCCEIDTVEDLSRARLLFSRTDALC